VKRSKSMKPFVVWRREGRRLQDYSLQWAVSPALAAYKAAGEDVRSLQDGKSFVTTYGFIFEVYECKHEHMPYTGRIPCTGIRQCRVCGLTETEIIERRELENCEA